MGGRAALDLCHQSGEAWQNAEQSGSARSRCCRRQLDFDLGFHLDDAGGDFDETQADGVELKVREQSLRRVRSTEPARRQASRKLLFVCLVKK